jgi:hypothetical protein
MKVVQVSARRGDSWISAAVFRVPSDFSEDQIEAAATPIAEALGQHEFETTGSVDGIACDIHLVTESDDHKNADPIAAEIERCIRAAIEGATRKRQTR